MKFGGKHAFDNPSSDEFPNHQNKCPVAVQQCNFCLIEYPRKETENHENGCILFNRQKLANLEREISALEIKLNSQKREIDNSKETPGNIRQKISVRKVPFFY